MINKPMTDSLNCSQCHSVLDNIGTQAFCPHCLASTSNLQQELRVVPEHYQSNCAGKRTLEQERKFNALIREFSDKHRELASKHELEFFRQKLRAIKAVTVNRKGSREAAAVVVYCLMIQEIKMTIREYCKSNNLNVKLFNQKYKIYRELQKREPQEVNFFKVQTKVTLKEEETYHKIEESPTERESAQSYYSQSQEQPDLQPEELTLVERAQHALNLIYDSIFNKYIYKDKKALVIRGLLEKFKEIDKSILKAIKYAQNTPFKIYYLIFAVLKTLGHRIGFMEYSQSIQKQTGYSLKRKPAALIRQIYQQTEDQPSNAHEKVKLQDNSSEVLAKQDKQQEKKTRKSRKKEKERVDLSDFEQF